MTDASGVPLWSGYSALGGELALGPALSGRFIMDGLVSQAVHGGVLQWSPEQGAVVTAPILNKLSEAGHDGWLEENHGIPEAGEPDLAILYSDAAIKNRFLGEANWRRIFGMPVAFVDHPHVAILRAENQAFQHWKIETGWGAGPGHVSTMNVGSMAVEAGIIPSESLELARGTPASDE